MEGLYLFCNQNHQKNEKQLNHHLHGCPERNHQHWKFSFFLVPVYEIRVKTIQEMVYDQSIKD